MQQDPQQPYMQGDMQPQGYPKPQGYPQPQPGYSQQFQQPKKRNPLLIIAGIVGALVLVCCIGAVAIAALGNKGTTSNNTNTGSKSNTSAGNTTSSGSQHFKPGDQVKVGDTFVVPVNSAKSSNGDDITQPKSGDTFMIVDVTIKNVSNQEQNISSLLQFNLKDTTGQAHTETIVNGATPPDGKVEPGDVLRGQLAYEVPTSQHSFTFSFEADITSSGQTIWDVAI